MNAPVILASGLEPLLFYLFIVVVWTVAKKLSEKSRRQPRDGDAPKAPLPPELNENLREFIETMTGRPLPRVEPPPPPPVVARRGPAVRPQPAPAKTEPRPPPAVRRPTRPKRPVPARFVSLEAPTPGTADIAETEITDAIRDEEGALTALGKMSALTRMQAMRLAMPSLRLPHLRDNALPRFRVDLKTHHPLRRAIVERVILGPPRGMGTERSDTPFEL